MKKARLLLNKAGLSIYLVAIMFSLVKTFILLPVIGFIWKLTLMTTPEGFISNANIKITLLKSPWVVFVGIILLCGFLLFSMWQVAATILGVGYAYEGRTPKVFDLICISFKEILKSTKLKNVMLVLYVVIILPFSNVFQATDMIGAFVVPEYIQDFINSKIGLSFLYIILAFGSTYLALRWIYVIPSFFLKNHDFKTASGESFKFTQKRTIKTFIRLFIYGVIESIRLALLPLIILVAVSTIAYISVMNKPYAIELFGVVLAYAKYLYNSICGVMLYLSTMCFIVEEYSSISEKYDNKELFNIPRLTHESKHHLPGQLIQLSASTLGALAILVLYLSLVILASVSTDYVSDFLKAPAVVAHKGYSSKAPENTMDAFELADKTSNAEFIELDVWSSKDGIPVVLHNETIQAATGRSGNIYDYTYDELKDIPAPYAMDAKLFEDARIPALEDVIKTYADSTPLIIEIKGFGQDEQLPAKIVALMEKYNCTDTSMIHSIDYGALKAVKMCNPDIKCGLIQAVVTGNSYDLPYADFLSVEHSFVNDAMVRQLHLRGKEVYVWTVNYNNSVKNLKLMDVDGIITDYPDDIAKAVKLDLELKDVIADSIQIDDIDDIPAQSEFEEGSY